jgi:hypothetical protein
MSLAQNFAVPDELDLIAFFAASPTERAPEDGYWCFEVRDAQGVKLRLSFNVFERSVQTEVSIGDTAIETVSHECAERLHVEGTELFATFTTVNAETLLVVSVTPAIRIRWSTLQTRQGESR